MRRLPAEELGPLRLDMLSMLASSVDPFAFIKYSFDIGPCKQLAKNRSAELGTKITITHILIKLLALAIHENPLFNQVVLDNRVYQMEDIHISNGYLVPGCEYAAAYIILTNPHNLSLQEIRRKLEQKQAAKARDLLSPRNTIRDALMRFVFRHNLMRLAGEKRVLTAAIQNGLSSNIILLNHIYERPSTFQVIKPVVTTLKIGLRIHAHGPVSTPFVENTAVHCREMLPLHIAIDHRLLHGIHAHRFGESLDRIAAEPERYMQ